jgi:hypothetical protein
MQTTTPTPNPNNPGKSTTLEVDCYEDSQQQTFIGKQTIDLVTLLSDVLLVQGQKLSREGNWLRLDNGFWLLPQWFACETRPDGFTRTGTTIEINHPTLAPNGLFEYQYAGSKDGATASFLEGLNQWAQTDAVALFDSMRAQPQDCISTVQTFSGSADKPEHSRRIIFGPTTHFAAEPKSDASVQKDDSSSESDDDEHDEFCPCCLFTRSLEAFQPILESSDYAAIKMFAYRDEDGNIDSDCRVNGMDFEEGKKALMEYVKTWPQRGFEYRKNLAVVQNAPAAETPPLLH